MDKQAILQAKHYHSQRDMKRHASREQRRQDQYRQARTAILKLGPKYPTIHRVYLYGSLVQPGRYGPKSDIDVAVVSDDVAEESRFWQALERELNCPIDLRPYQGAVAWAVDTYGECIYEREVSGPGA